MMALVKTRAFWARIGVAIAITLVGTVAKGMTDRPSLPRNSTNLRRVEWTGTLGADGALAVEVRYEFLAEAFKNDPERPRASLRTPDGAVRLRLNGRPAPVDGFNDVAPAATDDLVTTVAYEVPDAARRVGDRLLLDVSAVSPLHWLYNNYGYAEVRGVLRFDTGGTTSWHAGASLVRVAGAQDVRVEHVEDRMRFSGRVSTYDEAGIVALLPARLAPEASDVPSVDGRSADALFRQAADARSPNRVPDGIPVPDSGPPWLVIGLVTGALAISGAVLWLRNHRSRCSQ